MKVKVILGFWLRGEREENGPIEKRLALFIADTSVNALPPVGSSFFFDNPEPALDDMGSLGWVSKVAEIVTLPDYKNAGVSQQMIVLESIDFVEESGREGLLEDQLEQLGKDLEVHYEQLGKIGRTVFSHLRDEDPQRLWKYISAFEDSTIPLM